MKDGYSEEVKIIGETHFTGFARVLWHDLCTKVLQDRLFAHYAEENVEWLDFEHYMEELAKEVEPIIAQRVDTLVNVLELLKGQEE